MIYKKLCQDFLNKKLYNSYLIKTNSIDQALREVINFLKQNIFKTSYEQILAHPDFKLIQRESNSNMININQIRSICEFISKTSVNSPYKVNIISQADNMNSHAANNILKTLEEPPKNSIIILICQNENLLPKTLTSRCAKIEEYFTIENHTNNFDQILNPDIYYKTKLAFINQFNNKNIDRWIEFASFVEYTIMSLIKKKIGIKSDLKNIDSFSVKKLLDLNLDSLQNRYEKIRSLIKNTVKYDLDLRVSTIILLEHAFK